MGLSVRRFGWLGRCPKGTCALSISLSPVSVGESPHLWLTSAGTGLDGIHPLSGKRDDLLERRSTQGAALGPVAFSFVRRALYLADRRMTGKVSHPLTRSKYEMSVSINTLFYHNGQKWDPFFSKAIFCVCLRMETVLKSLGTVYCNT